MTSLRIALLAAALLSTAACTVTHRSVTSDGVKLAEKSLDGGGKVTYQLLPGKGEGPPRIHRTETVTREKASVKLSTSDIDTELAEQLGVTPWKGIRVDKVPSGSQVSEAGLTKGDVILSFGGVELTSRQQFEELLAGMLKPGEQIDLNVLRPGDQELGVNQEHLSLSFVPASKEVTDSKTSSIQLETSRGVQQLTGAQVAAIPADLAAEIFGANEPITIISGVVIGSPAYLSGLRRGDRVLDLDGRKVSGVGEVREIVRGHARHLNLSGAVLELPDAANATPQTMTDTPGDLEFNVLGPLGSHSASVEVVDDLDDSTRFHFPILFDYSSDVDSNSWSFLDFIFQFGANYESRYLPAETRSPAESSKLSLFPLGMFEFESTPSYNEYTFLWLITWRTRG
ncbi:MAG: PDZ domain-containing protein [Planctomycetota bacterium]